MIADDLTATADLERYLLWIPGRPLESNAVVGSLSLDAADDDFHFR